MGLTHEQIEVIKERAVDLLLEITPEIKRERVRGSVDLYVRILDQAHDETFGGELKPHEMTHDEMVAHDAAVGIPGFRRVE